MCTNEGYNDRTYKTWWIKNMGERAIVSHGGGDTGHGYNLYHRPEADSAGIMQWDTGSDFWIQQ